MPIDSHLQQADPFSLVPTFKVYFHVKCKLFVGMSDQDPSVVDQDWIRIDLVLLYPGSC
jgi:hypothetical protein